MGTTFSARISAVRSESMVRSAGKSGAAAVVQAVSISPLRRAAHNTSSSGNSSGADGTHVPNDSGTATPCTTPGFNDSQRPISALRSPTPQLAAVSAVTATTGLSEVASA